MYCEQCGAKNEENTKFCTSCGANMNGNGGVQPSQNIATPTQKQKPKFLKKIIIGVIVLAIVAGGGLLGYNFISDNFGSSEGGYENHPLVYAKDDLLFLKNANKKEAYPLTERYGYYEQGEMEGNYTTRYPLIQMSNDGETMFFADGISNEEFRLYYRKTGQKIPRGDGADEKGIRLVTGVTDFQASPNGDFVLYQKHDRLYISDLKEERSIASNVTNFTLSSDMKKVIFKKNYDLYVCGLGEKDQPEKIAADVSAVISPETEYEKIYYKKDDSLYYKEYGKDAIKVTSEVYNFTDFGTDIFITKANESQKGFNELFEDDCATTDSQMTNPSYSDFKKPDEDGYMRTDYDAYDEARKKYREKESRDDVREYFQTNPQVVTTYTLYKVVGTEIKEIANGLLDGYFSNKMITQQSGENGKILLSTVTSLNDAQIKVNNLKSNIETKTSLIKNDGTIVELSSYDKEYMTYIQISDDEKYFYCIEDAGSDYRGTLNRYSITTSGLGTKEKIYDDVSGYTLYGDTVVVHPEDGSIGIFDGGKYIPLSDSTNWRYTYKDGTLYYYDQYSNNNGIGNLMKYSNGKKEQIDIDVHDFVVRGADNCYYIKDYSSSSSRGELYQKKGGKPKKIDSDVSFIVY